MKLTRRSFLRLTVAATAAAACRTKADDPSVTTGTEPVDTSPTTPPTTSPTPPTDPTTPPVVDPVADLRTFCDDVLALVRSDPSHRVQRAADAVAAADVSALFALVRDQIAVQPGLTHLCADTPALGADPHANGWGCLFGPRGTLRGGAGLVRDKVELLAQLLRDAGEDAEVVWVDSTLTADDAAALRSVAPTEAQLHVPDETVAEWEQLLQIDLSDIEEGAPIDEAAVDALVDRLLALLPAGSSAYVDALEGTSLPMVRWNSAPGAPILCPLHPDATLDDPVLPVGAVRTAEPAVTPSVEVTLCGWRAGDDEPVQLVQASFDSADLAGRQLLVGAHPVATVDEVLAAEVGDTFEAFQTYLAVQALDGQTAPEPVLGSVLTTAGSTVQALPDGGLRFDDEVEVGTGSTGDPTSVVQVDVQVDAAAFPRVQVRAWPTDAAGQLVPGLGRDHLALTEEGSSVSAVLRADRGDVRVLLLWDLSTSMPAAYADAEDSGWLDEVATALRAARPDVRLTVQTFLVDQAETIAAEVSDPGRYDAVLVVTDGETLEDPDHFAALVVAGPPLFLADVFATEPGLHVAFADASGGDHSPVTEGTLEDQLVAWLLDVPEGSYVLDYTAVTDPSGLRTVELSVGAVAGHDDYEVPVEAVGSASRWTALELSLSSRGRTSRRVLAGLPPTLSARAHTPELRRAAYDDVLALLHGSLTLAAEAGHPGDAHLLDDHVQTALGALSWLEAEPVDADDVRELFTDGLALMPVGAALLADGGRPSEGAAYSHGLRLVLHRASHDADAGATRHQVDIVRLSPEHQGGSVDPFTATLRASARTALLEATLAPVDNTLARLDGIELVAVQPGDRPPFTFDDELDAYWEAVMSSGPPGWLLVPDDLTVRAAFWVDADTGQMVPLIDLGAGGGFEQKNAIYLLRSYIALAGWVSKVGPGLGVVSALMAVIAQYWAVATAAVSKLHAPDTAKLDDLYKKAVCNVFASVVGIGTLAGPINLLLTGLEAGYCKAVEKILEADNPSKAP